MNHYHPALSQWRWRVFHSVFTIAGKWIPEMIRCIDLPAFFDDSCSSRLARHLPNLRRYWRQQPYSLLIHRQSFYNQHDFVLNISGISQSLLSYPSLFPVESTHSCLRWQARSQLVNLSSPISSQNSCSVQRLSTRSPRRLISTELFVRSLAMIAWLSMVMR